jgi:AcrR family transcriptional regulator
VLAAARALFAEKGYDAATIRGIAAEAGVDAALVHHFFGSKDKVFVAAMQLPLQPAEIIPSVLEAGPREEVGERLVRFFLRIWDDPQTRAPFLALLRSAVTQERAAKMFREFVAAALLGPVADRLQVPRLRITVAAAQLVGIVMLRHVLELEPMASAEQEEIVDLVAPAIQRYLDQPEEH